MAGPEREIQTLVGLLNAAVAKEKRDLLNYKRDGAWHPIAASELAEKVRATAMGLEALGVRAGDHVGLLSENRPEWTMADLGILNCAAADVPIHTTQAEAQVHYILNDAGVRVMFISGQTQYNRVREALNELQKRGREADAAEPNLYETLRRSVRPNNLATLIYTSGTTGEPKGVMLTHRNLVSNVLANRQSLPVGEDDVILSFLPLSHIFERTGFYLYLLGRASIHYAESIEMVGQNLAEVRPHY